MALPAAQKLPIRHLSKKLRECEKDCYANRCGLRKLKNHPCEPCGDPCNPCPKCSEDPLHLCDSWTPEIRKNDKFNYKFRDDYYSECCEMGHLSRPPCAAANRFGYQVNKPKSSWQMLHHTPGCCPPCLPDPPRFDELFYRIRKMSEKEYFPTWSECPKPRIVPKIVCCYDKEPMEVPRRIRCKPPQTACPLPEDALNKKLLVCKVGGDPNCVKIYTPCCCPARNPPKCLKLRHPMCIDRLEVPSPSFSECCKHPSKPVRPNECECSSVGPLCGYGPLSPRIHRTC